MLSDKELTVLQYASEGKTRDEIAVIVGVSPETVKTHRKNVYTKLGIHEKAEFVKYADKNEIFRDK